MACEETGPASPEELAAAAQAVIPAVVGLTLSNTWMPAREDYEPYEHECLAQIAAADSHRLVFSNSCQRGNEYIKGTHEICRSDLRNGRAYRNEYGPLVPPLLSGTTSKALSTLAFQEARTGGSTWLRFVDPLGGTDGPTSFLEGLAGPGFKLDWVGRFAATARGHRIVLVNDRAVELPVLILEADMRDSGRSRPGNERPGRARLVVLDEPRFPLVLELRMLDLGSSITYTKITYPAAASLERELIERRRAVVYGIYFAYNSAEIRPESGPVLEQIASVLRARPEWRVRIEGHTDSIGGDAFNLGLSERRAQAVRAWLVERHAVDAGRLLLRGYGSSVPKDTNDTPEGRARNRRVELALE